MAGTRGGDNVSIPRFLLEDSPQLAKKIQDFDDLERRAAEAAATIGDVGDIANIKSQAKQARDEADAELAKQKELTENSRVECERLISEATATASRKVAEAEIAAKSMKESARAEMNEANSMLSQAEKLGQAAATAQSNVDAQEKSLQQKADDLAGREQELKETKEQFARLRTLIQQNIP